MLVADTKNQAIQIVDMGHSTITLLHGFNLDMPYSVKLHHHSKWAFIADTKSNAIKKVNLYTKNTISILGIAYPTDMVSFDDKLVICDAKNHTLWIFSGIDYYKLNDEINPWPTQNLQLLSGSQRGYQEGIPSKFDQPMGITHDNTRNVLYVTDFGNRLIREVNPLSGNTILRVGNPSLEIPGHIDGFPLNSALSGPTNLAYYNDAVYFSDRNPHSDNGAFRVWYITQNMVKTLVGQSSRQIGDGLVTLPNVGASAIWGITLSNNWMAWVEADTNSLRISSDPPQIPCPPGKFYSTEWGHCISCTNTIPYDVVYIGSGNVDGNDCPWVCPDPPNYMPFTCPDFMDGVENGKLAATYLGSIDGNGKCVAHKF